MGRETKPDLTLLGRVHQIYERLFEEHPEGRVFLQGQGIIDARVVERFRVGYSAGTVKELLPKDQRLHRALRALGILVGPGRGREAMEGSVVLPLLDAAGRVVELIGYPTKGGAPRRGGATGGVLNAAALRSHPEVRVFSDPIMALKEIAGGDLAVVSVFRSEWSEITDRTIRENPPHRAHVVESEHADSVRGRLKALGVETDGQSQSPLSEPRTINNGFSATFGKRRYVAQAVKSDNPRNLRVLLRAVGSAPGRFHLDALNLYSSRERGVFVREAALLFSEDSSLVEADLGRIITMAEEFLRRRPGTETTEVGEEAREEALEYLRDPELMKRILTDFDELGLVGERENKLAGYLVAVSRKLPDPLSFLVLSRSAAGKSTLAEAVATLVPPEDVLRLTRLTGQALFYQKNQSMRQKLLVVEEESGVAEAAYPLRILQSAKRLAVATAQGSHEVEGPVAVIVTTTSSDLNDETKSRFLVVSIDESRKQTRAIQDSQRRRESGKTEPREEIIRRHHALQRILRPVEVVNPFAEHLRFPDERLATRREHPKYLALIRSVTFLHQYQRNEEEGRVLVDLRDIEIAHELADRILGQNLEDLSPPAKRLLEAIHDWRRKGRFTRTELRSTLGWGTGQIWMYMKELADAEWVIDHGGKPREYSLAWDGREGTVFLGLTPVSEIRAILRRSSGSLRKVKRRDIR